MALQAGHSLPNNGMFCAIEAKKDELFARGTGELLEQMKALHIRERYDLNSFIEYCFIKILIFFTYDIGNLLMVHSQMDWDGFSTI